MDSLKGTVSRDFSALVFFKLLIQVLIDIPRNNLKFFRLFTEIFDKFGALPVSRRAVKFASSLSLTLVRNFSPVSMTLVSFSSVNEKKTLKNSSPVEVTTVKPSFTGVNETRETLQSLSDTNLSDTEHTVSGTELF
jgi:hypothetical protein